VDNILQLNSDGAKSDKREREIVFPMHKINTYVDREKYLASMLLREVPVICCKINKRSRFISNIF
jgi:hypothetical protein